MKAQYTFTWRDAEKIILSMYRVEPNSMKKQQSVMTLLYHEAYRNFSDRVLMTHDCQWFE